MTAQFLPQVVAVAFILNAGRLMLDKIGTLLKAQYRAEKTETLQTEKMEDKCYWILMNLQSTHS
jgi:hypothetical protein